MFAGLISCKPSCDKENTKGKSRNKCNRATIYRESDEKHYIDHQNSLKTITTDSENEERGWENESKRNLDGGKTGGSDPQNEIERKGDQRIKIEPERQRERERERSALPEVRGAGGRGCRGRRRTGRRWRRCPGRRRASTSAGWASANVPGPRRRAAGPCWWRCSSRPSPGPPGGAGAARSGPATRPWSACTATGSAASATARRTSARARSRCPSRCSSRSGPAPRSAANLSVRPSHSNTNPSICVHHLLFFTCPLFLDTYIRCSIPSAVFFSFHNIASIQVDQRIEFLSSSSSFSALEKLDYSVFQFRSNSIFETWFLYPCFPPF